MIVFLFLMNDRAIIASREQVSNAQHTHKKSRRVHAAPHKMTEYDITQATEPFYEQNLTQMSLQDLDTLIADMFRTDSADSDTAKHATDTGITEGQFKLQNQKQLVRAIDIGLLKEKGFCVIRETTENNRLICMRKQNRIT